MAFSLAKLFVEIGGKTNAFDSAMDGVKRRLSSTSVAIGTFVGNAASALANLGVQLSGDVFRGTIGSASELNAVISKTSVIFGDSAATIIREGDAMAKSFGASKTEYVNAATSFGAVFKGLGKSQAEAADLGNQLAKLGMDLASFDGSTNAEAFTAISSALRGEMGPIEKFRIFLSADKIEAEALASGLAKTKGEIDDMIKKQATLNLILKQSADAQGDLTRTAGDSDNQFKKLTGGIANIGTSIGTFLLPPITAAVSTINGFIDVVGGMGSQASSVFNAVGSVASTAFANIRAAGEGVFELLGRFPEWWTNAFGDGPMNLVSSLGSGIYNFVGGALEGIGVFMRNLPAVWDVAVLQISQGVINIGEYMSAFMTNAGIIGNYIATNWSSLVVDGLTIVGTAFQNLGTNLLNLAESFINFLNDPTAGFSFNWTPLLDGFVATTEKMPELIKPSLTSLQDQIDSKLSEIGKREAQRVIDRNKTAVQAATAPASAKGAATPAGSGKIEKEFKSESLGAAEFARKLQGGLLEGKDKTPERQLTELQKIATATSASAAALSKPQLAVMG